MNRLDDQKVGEAFSCLVDRAVEIGKLCQSKIDQRTADDVGQDIKPEGDGVYEEREPDQKQYFAYCRNAFRFLGFGSHKACPFLFFAASVELFQCLGTLALSFFERFGTLACELLLVLFIFLFACDKDEAGV